MKKWIVTAIATVTLSGCAQLTDYASAVKTPPPATLVGNWQTVGPQDGLVSKEARASLIISATGDTLDCRQWQRVIAKAGKVTHFDDEWVNVNQEARVMPLELKGTTLHYDKLTLQKVSQPTVECQKALADQAKPQETKVEQPANTVTRQPKKHNKMIYTEKL